LSKVTARERQGFQYRLRDASRLQQPFDTLDQRGRRLAFAGEFELRSGSFSEKQVPKVLLAKHALQFSECKERNIRYKIQAAAE
jgi:hypothetical protein